MDYSRKVGHVMCATPCKVSSARSVWRQTWSHTNREERTIIHIAWSWLTLQVQMKPVTKRMQIEVPLHRESDNYNSLADPSLQLDSIKLSSTSVDMPASYAVASIRCLAALLHPYMLPWYSTVF